MDQLYSIINTIADNKHGLELGGPSNTGTAIYQIAQQMDNVIFSKETVWSNHNDSIYRYGNNKTGKVYINDATDISNIPNQSYDFIFASHILEHIANPIKALHEWRRVVRTNGYLILILPEKSVCFDHKRNYTPFSTLLQKYQNNVGEDNLDSLSEILELHDLSMDLAAGNADQFRERSLHNYTNRCLHHHVFNPALLDEITTYMQCKTIFTITNGLDIWYIMQNTDA